jgi:4'-phosphopantetheinyl transferase EntD
MTKLNNHLELREQSYAEAIAQLFPYSVCAASVRLSDHLFPLFVEEEEAIFNSVTKRRIEFAAGRHCARNAMVQLGYTARGIPKGPDRAPIWPIGLVGSITHSADLCVAVLAHRRDYRSIGIDMELVDAVPSELAKDILRPDETAALNSHINPDGADWPTVHFCLKEAAYKAFYPRYRRIIAFQDMRVRVNADDREFIAEPLCISTKDRSTFRGKYFVHHGRICAACWQS